MSMLENLRERCRIARSKITDNNVIDSEIVDDLRNRIDHATRMSRRDLSGDEQCENGEIEGLRVREISTGKGKEYVAEATRNSIEGWFNGSDRDWDYRKHVFKVYAVSNGASLVIDLYQRAGSSYYTTNYYVTDEKGNKNMKDPDTMDASYKTPDFDEAIKFMGRFPDVAKFMNKYVNVKEARNVERSGANQQKTLNPNLLQKRKGLGE